MPEDFAATESPAPQCKTAWWQHGWFLALLLFLAVLLNNSELIFRTHYYEADDYAANSLQVLKAKHFAETVGNYCRFGFHHPGPAFFYVMAWGEIAAESAGGSVKNGRSSSAKSALFAPEKPTNLPTLGSSFRRVALSSNPAKTGGDPNAVAVPLTPDVDLVVHRCK